MSTRPFVRHWARPRRASQSLPPFSGCADGFSSFVLGLVDAILRERHTERAMSQHNIEIVRCESPSAGRPIGESRGIARNCRAAPRAFLGER